MAKKTIVSAPKSPKIPKEPRNKDASKKAWKRFKRRFSFFLFLLLCGYLFYMGWKVQFQVPEGQAALLHSRITGYEGELVKPGDFLWRWQGMIPTDLTVHLVPTDYRTVSLESQGELPSGNIYLAHAGLEGNFDYHLTLDVQYRLQEDHYIEQVEKGLLTPDNMDAFFVRTDNQIMDHAVQFLQNPDLLAEEMSRIPGLINLQEEDFIAAFPYLEFALIQIRFSKLPDMALYTSLRQDYLHFLHEKNNQLTSLTVTQMTRDMQVEEKMEILREYGELITEYPLLLEFFSMDNGVNWQEFSPDGLIQE